jgi:ferredoxin
LARRRRPSPRRATRLPVHARPGGGRGRSGREAAALPAGAPLLPAIRGLGAEVDASCEGGACRLRWLEGPPLRRDRVLSPAERQRDVMVCVAGCAGPRPVLDL